MARASRGRPLARRIASQSRRSSLETRALESAPHVQTQFGLAMPSPGARLGAHRAGTSKRAAGGGVSCTSVTSNHVTGLPPEGGVNSDFIISPVFGSTQSLKPGFALETRIVVAIP